MAPAPPSLESDLAHVAAEEVEVEMCKELGRLRTENRRLRRENRWNCAEVERWKARAADLEARLLAAEAAAKKRGRKAEVPLTPRSPGGGPASAPVDWAVWHMLGAGQRSLEEEQAEERRWAKLSVDWSVKGLPRGIVPKTKYWDRGLPLDWNSPGLPTLAFKKREPRSPSMKAAPALEIGPVDWWVWDMLPPSLGGDSCPEPEDKPSRAALAAARPGKDNWEELMLDWSGHHLPYTSPSACRRAAGHRARPPQHRRLPQRRVLGRPQRQEATAEMAIAPEAPHGRPPQPRALELLPRGGGGGAGKFQLPKRLRFRITEPGGRRGCNRSARA